MCELTGNLFSTTSVSFSLSRATLGTPIRGKRLHERRRLRIKGKRWSAGPGPAVKEAADEECALPAESEPVPRRGRPNARRRGSECRACVRERATTDRRSPSPRSLKALRRHAAVFARARLGGRILLHDRQPRSLPPRRVTRPKGREHSAIGSLARRRFSPTGLLRCAESRSRGPAEADQRRANCPVP